MGTENTSGLGVPREPYDPAKSKDLSTSGDKSQPEGVKQQKDVEHTDDKTKTMPQQKIMNRGNVTEVSVNPNLTQHEITPGVGGDSVPPSINPTAENKSTESINMNHPELQKAFRQAEQDRLALLGIKTSNVEDTSSAVRSQASKTSTAQKPKEPQIKPEYQDKFFKPELEAKDLVEKDGVLSSISRATAQAIISNCSNGSYLVRENNNGNLELMYKDISGKLKFKYNLNADTLKQVVDDLHNNGELDKNNLIDKNRIEQDFEFDNLLTLEAENIDPDYLNSMYISAMQNKEKDEAFKNPNNVVAPINSQEAENILKNKVGYCVIRNATASKPEVSPIDPNYIPEGSIAVSRNIDGQVTRSCYLKLPQGEDMYIPQHLTEEQKKMKIVFTLNQIINFEKEANGLSLLNSGEAKDARYALELETRKAYVSDITREKTAENLNRNTFLLRRGTGVNTEDKGYYLVAARDVFKDNKSVLGQIKYKYNETDNLYHELNVDNTETGKNYTLSGIINMHIANGLKFKKV